MVMLSLAASEAPWQTGAVGLNRGGVGHFCGRSSGEWNGEDALEWEKAGSKGRLRKSNEDRLVEECLREEQVIPYDDDKKGAQIRSQDLQLHCETVMASRFTVGYALTSKKTKSFLQPKLEKHARNKGIAFVAIDRSMPLEQQGPFDVVLHKISGEEWQEQIESYRQIHPDVIVLDPPNAIQHVYNRQSMLQDVADLNLCHCKGKVGVPKQLVVTGDPESIPDRVVKAGLRFPLVVKPLVIDGTAKSHSLSLAFNEHCLSELTPPLVLQEFVNHGGVLFKVYIVGDIIKVVRRFSLPDLHEGEPLNCGVIPFPRVSCASASADEADLDPRVAELPPRELLDLLARELRRKLGLRLFNLDIIREGGRGNLYYVIDINYFPGYGKMPDYEYVFTDFLLSLAASKGKQLAGSAL